MSDDRQFPFLNLHVLFTFAAGNPNRDDTGTPKSVVYGGVERSRISSQAMTRAKRVYFEAETVGETTYRSVLAGRRIAKLVEEVLAESGRTLSEGERAEATRLGQRQANGLVMDSRKADQAAQALSTAEVEQLSEDEKAKRVEEAGATLTWLAEVEMRAAARKIAEKLVGESVTLEPDGLVYRGRTDSLSIAAFGRMFAERPDLQTEAAVQRAHAITTHQVVTEVDYFTAVDDLRTEDAGAGHINAAQLTGGVYYWHANVDRRQLAESWSGMGQPDAAEKLEAFLQALCLALPSGKENTSAHQGLPAAVLLVPSMLPATLVAAFERPVRSWQDGLLAPSLGRLLAELDAQRTGYPAHFGQPQIALLTSAVEALDQTDRARLDAVEQVSLDALAQRGRNYLLADAR